MSNDSSTISEYFKLNDEYINKFGPNTILLMQVGAFFEIYGLRSQDNNISHSQICEISRICNLNISDKKNIYKNLNVVMAGFRDYSLDKYLPKIVGANFHAVVYDQEKQLKVLLGTLLEPILQVRIYLMKILKMIILQTILCVYGLIK